MEDEQRQKLSLLRQESPKGSLCWNLFSGRIMKIKNFLSLIMIDNYLRKELII